MAACHFPSRQSLTDCLHGCKSHHGRLDNESSCQPLRMVRSLLTQNLHTCNKVYRYKNEILMRRKEVKNLWKYVSVHVINQLLICNHNISTFMPINVDTLLDSMKIESQLFQPLHSGQFTYCHFNLQVWQQELIDIMV